jgi:hypothetical protein
MKSGRAIGIWRVAAVAFSLASTGCGADGFDGEENVDDLQQGLQVSLAAIADTSLDPRNASTNYGNDSVCTAHGISGKHSCVIRWDLSSIPTNATIQSAQLTLTSAGAASGGFSINMLTTAWVENEATWDRPSNTTAWDTRGGASDIAGRFCTLGAQTGANVMPVAPNVVGAWVRDPSTNKGVIVTPRTSGARIDIRSSESSPESQRPMLRITYTTP